MIHVYPVGVLYDWQRGRLRYGLRRYLSSQIRERNWRAVRNYFNGYLAEHDGCDHDAGRGWSRRTAVRRVNALHGRVHFGGDA